MPVEHGVGKRLLGFLGFEGKAGKKPEPLGQVLQECETIRKTLRKHTALLGEIAQACESLSRQELLERTEPYRACSEAFFHLDRTLRESGGVGPSHLDALRLVWQKMEALLATAQIRIIRATDIPFDAREHEAVQAQGGAEGTPRVLKVLQPGYVHKDRVLRAAKVVVGGPGASDAKEKG